VVAAVCAILATGHTLPRLVSLPSVPQYSTLRASANDLPTDL